jgi:ankyrin repeat protein
MREANRRGFTALMTAAENGQSECVSALLAAGADKEKATRQFHHHRIYIYTHINNN